MMRVSTHSVHQFAEKVALITDISNPIGKAAALQLALYGAYVVVGLPEGVVDDAVGDLEQMGTISLAVAADASTPEGIDRIIASADDKFGRLDFLVNSLNFEADSTFMTMSAEETGELLRQSVAATMLVTKQAHRLMANRPRARIVNVISGTERSGDPVFAALFAAVEGFTRSLARALPANFRVNAVSVNGELTSGADADPELFAPRPKVSADDAARTVLYLLSSEAVSVNGQVIVLV